ncbi:MAG: hypothetical protein ACRERC_15290 [Candidatus Binatia bacterium]
MGCPAYQLDSLAGARVRASCAAPQRTEERRDGLPECDVSRWSSRPPRRPEGHECRAHLARLCGDAPVAQHEIEAARRLYAEMGARAQAERLARELSV